MKQRQQNLLLKQKRPLIVDRKAMIRGIFQLFLMGGILSGAILFYVWTRIQVVQLNYELLDLTKAEREIFMKHERLKVELAMLMSPSRLSSMAENQFKLKSPSRHQVIYIK